MPRFSQTVTDPLAPVTAPLGRPGGQTGIAPQPPAATADPGTSAAAPTSDPNVLTAGLSDPNGLSKAQKYAAASGLRIVSVTDGRDPGTNAPNGLLTVIVANQDGDQGTVQLGPDGDPKGPPIDGAGNALKTPTPRNTTGTTAEQTTANANATRAASASESTKAVGGYIVWHHEDPNKPGTFIDSTIGPTRVTNPSEKEPKVIDGHRFEYQEGTPDANGNPTEGQWVDKGAANPPQQTPANVEDTRHNTVMETLEAARDKASADANAATQAANLARIDLEKQAQDWTQKYQNGELNKENAALNEQIWKDHMEQINKQADQELAKATAAQQTARDAQNAWYQRQQVENDQARLGTEKATQQQTGEYQKNQTAISAAGEVEKNRANLATEATARGGLGAGMLNDRATHATSLLQNWTNAAMGNKNFGLGGPLPANLGSNLMSDAQGFATQAMGGNDIMKQAADMVHAANPDLAKTPAGSAYTAVLQQMLEKRQQELQGGQQQDNTQSQATDAATNAPANPNSATPDTSSPANAADSTQAQGPTGGVDWLKNSPASPMSNPSNTPTDPSDPAFLGTVIGAAMRQHLQGGFTAPSGGTA